MLLLKTCYGNALSSTIHFVQRKTGKNDMERANLSVLALKLREALKCGDDLWHL